MNKKKPHFSNNEFANDFNMDSYSSHSMEHVKRFVTNETKSPTQIKKDKDEIKNAKMRDIL